MLEHTISTIPLFLLARIVLQTFTVPEDLLEQFALLPSLREALATWGQSCDLGAFLNDCLRKARKETNDVLTPDHFWWRDLQAVTKEDVALTLDNIKQDAKEAPVGVRVELIAESLRQALPLKFNLPIIPDTDPSSLENLHRKYQFDPAMIFYNNSYTSIQTVCDGVNEYFARDSLTQPNTDDVSKIHTAIEFAKAYLLSQSEEAHMKQSHQANGVSNCVTATENVKPMDVDSNEKIMCGDYTLFAVLMCLKKTRRTSRQQWRLYVKDFTDTNHGWKVYHSDGHGEVTTMIAGDQAIRDIRGQPTSANPSLNDASTDTLRDVDQYKPAYFVYVNAYLVSNRQETLKYLEEETGNILGKRKIITEDDYYSDYDIEDMHDGEVCKHCLIGIEAEGNRIFICDACNQSVHQFCETPCIRDEEIDIDPWMCRDCTAAGRRPIIYANGKENRTNSTHPSSDEPAAKRMNIL